MRVGFVTNRCRTPRWGHQWYLVEAMREYCEVHVDDNIVDADVIFTEMESEKALKIAKELGVPCCSTIVATEYPPKKIWGDRLLAVSNVVRERYLKFHPEDKEKTYICYQGASYPPGADIDFKREGSGEYLFWVGAIDKGKRIHLIIDEASKLNEELVIMSGEVCNPEYYSQIRSTGGRVRFVSGDDRLKYKLLSRAKALAMAGFETEVSCIPAMEAGLMGVPVMCYDVQEVLKEIYGDAPIYGFRKITKEEREERGNKMRAIVMQKELTIEGYAKRVVNHLKEL